MPFAYKSPCIERFKMGFEFIAPFLVMVGIGVEYFNVFWLPYLAHMIDMPHQMIGSALRKR